ncbi:MAG: hypothetical protein RIS85_652, partial [Pseudomonadota bacterium]
MQNSHIHCDELQHLPDERWEHHTPHAVRAGAFARKHITTYMRAMQTSPDTAPDTVVDALGPMPIPGHIDPVPVPREVTPREDGRIDLIGLPRLKIAEIFAEAGLDTKAAKLRAKQVYHWLYHRGVTEFDAMTDIAKTMRPWLAERFVIGRPDIVEAQ